MGLIPGYKQTDVGVIPDEWDVNTLGELGEALIGLTYKPEDVRESGTLVLRSSNIQNDALAFDDNVFVGCDIPERIKVRPGDVLICVRNGSRDLIGKSVLLDERTLGMTFGAFMAVYRSPIGRFAGFLFQSRILKRQINEHLGATINQITNKSLNSFRVPVPATEAEQHAIAVALSDVDALLEGLARQIAKKRDLKEAAMQQLLSGDSRLPGYSGEWRVRRLGDHASFLKHGVCSRAQLRASGTVKYLHYGDIHGATDVRLNASTEVMPFLPGAQAYRLDRLTNGDVVFVDASEDLDGVGKSVEIADADDVELVAGLHTIAVRFDNRVLADGFKGFLQFCPPFREHLRRLAAGTKVLATNRSHIAGVEMPLPDPEEQVAIAAILSDMDDELRALRARREKAVALKEAMMQELLTGRIRLVTSDHSHA